MTETTLDIAAIMRAIPHRYPFLLVDRVVEMNQEADVVLDYQTAAEMNERMRLPRFDPQTGQPLGRPAAPEAVEAPAPRAPRPR